ncbi:hypothetical protein FACS189454_06270 [Planctomycetales bacterium]|nr:hypothetical protein FACS189454_06270 [Planctomycetales bacterium]
MIVTASTSCVPNLSLSETFDRLADLEYTSTELVIGEQGTISFATLVNQFDPLVKLCKMTRHVSPVAIYFDLEPDNSGYAELFTKVCQFAKAVKVVVVTVHASVPGTPYNEENDRLRELVRIGLMHGVVVGIATEGGRITDDPGTVASLCKTIKGLGATLDPSHYIFKHKSPKDYDAVLPYTCFVRLRDTTAEQFQICVGQGAVEFGRLVIQLSKINYKGALCADLAPLPGLDPFSELRKMRLLLESLL